MRRLTKFILTLFIIVAQIFSIGVVPQLNKPIKASEIFSFPWAANESRQWWNRYGIQWHGGDDCEDKITNPEPAKCAIDFGGAGSWQALAMANGTIISVQHCTAANNKTTNVKINHNGIEIIYMHLDSTQLSSKVSGALPATIYKGEPLGNLKTGNFGVTTYPNGSKTYDPCGNGQQLSNDSHVHIIIPTTPFVIDGWTFDYPSSTATHATLGSKNSGDNFTSENYPFSTAAPLLQSPSNSSVITKSNIDFSWSSVGGATLYELQLSHTVNGQGTVINTYTTTDANLSLNKGLISNPEGITWKVRAKHANNQYTNWSTSRTLSYIPDRTSLLEFNGLIYRAYRNNTDQIITEVSTNDLLAWTEVSNTGSTPGNVSMVVFNNKIFQSVRGNTDGKVYIRNSEDGTNWSAWTEYGTGVAASDVTTTVYNNKLYQTIAGASRKVFMRFSDDGINWSNWSDSSPNTHYSASEVDSIVFDEKMYQSSVGLDNKIYVRTLDLNNDWSTWGEYNTGSAKSYTGVSSVVHNGKLYQSIIGMSGTVFTRNLESTGWTPWSGYTIGSSVVEVDMISFENKLFQTIRGNSGKIWVRVLYGSAWGNWEQLFSDKSFQSQINLVVQNNTSLQMYMKEGSTGNIYRAFYNIASLPGWTAEWDLLAF
jgi:hypothetical protein